MGGRGRNKKGGKGRVDLRYVKKEHDSSDITLQTPTTTPAPSPNLSPRKVDRPDLVCHKVGEPCKLTSQTNIDISQAIEDARRAEIRRKVEEALAMRVLHEEKEVLEKKRRQLEVGSASEDLAKGEIQRAQPDISSDNAQDMRSECAQPDTSSGYAQQDISSECAQDISSDCAQPDTSSECALDISSGCAQDISSDCAQGVSSVQAQQDISSDYVQRDIELEKQQREWEEAKRLESERMEQETRVWEAQELAEQEYVKEERVKQKLSCDVDAKMYVKKKVKIDPAILENGDERLAWETRPQREEQLELARAKLEQEFEERAKLEHAIEEEQQQLARAIEEEQLARASQARLAQEILKQELADSMEAEKALEVDKVKIYADAPKIQDFTALPRHLPQVAKQTMFSCFEGCFPW